jgi:hypothetical protein
VILAVSPLGLLSCTGQLGKPPPLDRPVFPMGMALSPDGERLAVISSNFNFAFDVGAVLLADLGAVRDRLTGPDVVINDAFSSGVFIPTFGDRPVFDATGEHLFVTSRAENLLHELLVDDSGVISCGGAEVCRQAPHALALVGNDPFDIVLLDQGVDDNGAVVVRGLVTHQSAREASIFTLNAASSGNDRLRIESAPVDFGEGAFGVRAAVMRPGDDAVGRPARIFATVERRDGTAIVGVDLVSFEVPAAGRAADVTFVRQDLESLLGTRTTRDIAVVDDAIVVALRFPDALARFVVDPATGDMTLTALKDTCLEPTSLALTGAAAGNLVLVTCQDNHSVELIDPITLESRDALRFYGREPYDIVVDAARQQAFVSFFLDNSIGAISLVDDDGLPGLHAIGRLGQPLPPPEDGRE